MTHWCSFHELILNWYSATTQKFLFWGPKWAQNTIAGNNSSETHRNYWKPYINRILRSIMTHWWSFHELILNWYSATTQKFPFWSPKWAQNKIASNNSSETHRNYWKPYINRFVRSIMTYWCSFHELILNGYSATNQKYQFWVPKWAQNRIFQ